MKASGEFEEYQGQAREHPHQIFHQSALHELNSPLRGTVLILLLGFHVQSKKHNSHLKAGEALGERIFNTHSLHFNNSAYESIITTRSFHRTRNELLSAN